MRPIIALLLAMLAWPVGAGEAVRVTIEGPEYCHALAARLASRPGKQPESTRPLLEEGLRLCEAGQIRTGIAKLRRALRAGHSP
jgi:phage terminase large subunit-like protein